MTDRPVKSKRSIKDKFLISVGILLSLVAILGAAGAGFAFRQSQKLVRAELDLVETPNNEPANWLLVGTDDRSEISSEDSDARFFLDRNTPIEGVRTDTMIVARVDPDLNRIDIISVPRDLWVDIDGSFGRVNSAYQVPSNATEEELSEGRRRLVRTIQSNLGIEINHYAEVDFRGFQSVVDSLGGVEIDFERPARDLASGLSVDAGTQVLDGSQALAYARARSYQEQNENGRWTTDPTGDLGRTERQRNFLVEVASELVSSSTSLNFINTDSQISVLAENVVFSSSVTISSLTSLATTYQSVGVDSITSHTLPVVATTEGTASVLRLAQGSDDALSLFRGFSTLAGATVDVFNGSGVPGQATQAATNLRQTNIAVGLVSDYPTRVALTEIRFNPAFEAVAIEFQNSVAFASVLVEDPSIEELALITGEDF